MSIFVYFCLFLYSCDGQFCLILAGPENCELDLIIHKFNDAKPFSTTF